MSEKATPAEVILYVIGGAAFVYEFYKGKITGFYSDEVPVLAVTALVAVVCLFAASRMTRKRKTEDLARRDREKGVL